MGLKRQIYQAASFPSMFLDCPWTETPNLLFPFGPAVGDSTLHRNDDGATDVITISTPFPLFGQLNSDLYVSS